MGIMADKQQKPSELDQVKHDLDKKTKEAEDYLSHLKRLQADFENYIKRSDKERKDVIAFASEKLIAKLLTVLDEFEQALKAMKDSPKEDLMAGIELLYKNFKKTLEDEGLEKIPATNVPADPYLHEVILREATDKVQDGIILEEIQPGYKLKDKVIRYAKVKVAKAN